MSVLVSPIAGTTIGTPGGFLKAEAYNMGMFSTTDVTVAPCDIPVVFATGGRSNAGVVLAIETSAASLDRSLRVSLQQIMGGCTLNASTDECTFTAHGFPDGQAVLVTGTSNPSFSPTSVYGGSAHQQVFYARPTGSSDPANTFFLYDTQAHAVSGGTTGKINITGAGSGCTLYADRGSCERTAAQLYNGSSYAWGSNFVPFTWTGYGIDTTAGTWRFHAFQYGGTTGNYSFRTSDGSHPFFCEISSIQATCADNDCVVAAGPVTMDVVARTLKGVLGTGDTSGQAPALIICKSASALSPASGNENFRWDGTAPRTLTIDGTINMAFHSGFRAGSAAARIAAANMGTVNFIAPTVGTKSGFWHSETDAQLANPGRMGIWIYGERPAVERTTFAGDIAAGATSLTSAVETGWKSGDLIAIGRITDRTQVDYSYYTLNGDASRTTVNFTPAIPANKGRTSGGILFRLNGYGFKITGPDTSSVMVFSPQGIAWLTIDGVQIMYIAGQANYYSLSANQPLADDAGTGILVTHCSVFGNVLASGGKYPTLFGTYLPVIGVTITYCNSLLAAIANLGFAAWAPGVQTYTNNWHVCPNAPSVCGTNGVFTDNVYENMTGGFNQFVSVSGFGYTFARNKFWGHSISSSSAAAVAFVNTSLNPLLWEGNSYDNCQGTIYLGSGNVFNTGPLNGDLFGQIAANNVDFMGYTYSTYQVVVTNPIGQPRLSTNVAVLKQMSPYSYLRFKNWNQTPEDYRAWYYSGRFINPSQGDAIQQVCTYGPNPLVNSYNVATQAVSGFRMALCITGRIGNAAYWGGTNTLPNIAAIYDGGTSVNQTMAQSTDAQSLVIPFTPGADLADITIRLTTMSDACNADTNNTCVLSAVTWSDCYLTIRKYGYSFGLYPITINQTTDSYVATVQTPALNPYITESNQATVDAYTGIAWDESGIRVSVPHTVYEVYDFIQSLCTQDAFMGKEVPFTTIDKSIFTASVDFTVDGAALTAGTAIIEMAGSDFHKLNGGSYDGIIITSTYRDVHLRLNRLVAGSTVQVYDNTAAAELYKGVVAGTSLDYVFRRMADHELRIRVRRAGYLPFETTGDILDSGLSLNVAQVVDTVYVNNAIDGSTVTEFTLQEGVVGVFVDDPDNMTTGQRLYNWYMHEISTVEFIDDQADLITAQTAWSYVLADDLKIRNLDTVNPLFMSGANISNVSADGQVVDTSGGTIIINGYFPFSSSADVGKAVVKAGALTLSQFLALK